MQSWGTPGGPRGASRTQQRTNPRPRVERAPRPLCLATRISSSTNSQVSRHRHAIACPHSPSATVTSSQAVSVNVSFLRWPSPSEPIDFLPVRLPRSHSSDTVTSSLAMAAFIPGSVTAAVGGRRRPALCTSRGTTAGRTRVETRCLVVDVGSAEQLQVVLESAKEADALVVIDYSTTWCGPCKVRVAPHLIAVGYRLRSCPALDTLGRGAQCPYSVSGFPETLVSVGMPIAISVLLTAPLVSALIAS